MKLKLLIIARCINQIRTTNIRGINLITLKASRVDESKQRVWKAWPFYRAKQTLPRFAWEYLLKLVMNSFQIQLANSSPIVHESALQILNQEAEQESKLISSEKIRALLLCDCHIHC